MKKIESKSMDMYFDLQRNDDEAEFSMEKKDR
jgi:hypothetical protein